MQDILACKSDMVIPIWTRKKPWKYVFDLKFDPQIAVA
jgi:hypothetical protein